MENTNHITLADRYLGVMLGLACGDALGGPVEFMSREEIAAKHPGGVREFVGGGWLNLAPGEITDDTQLTLALSAALTEAGLDLDLLARHFLEWYQSNPKDIGNTTRLAMEALAEGRLPLDTGAYALSKRGAEGAAANGGVMRCAPVALRFRRDPHRLVQASLDSARVTHAEPRAAWGAVAVNQGIVHLLDGGDIATVAAAAVASVKNEAVREAVLGAAGHERQHVRAGGFVLHTVGAAFWSLAHGANAREAIEIAVSLGEDTDTTGAVTGALAGAAYGAGALPQSWVASVQYRDRLEEEARRLLALAEG